MLYRFCLKNKSAWSGNPGLRLQGHHARPRAQICRHQGLILAWNELLIKFCNVSLVKVVLKSRLSKAGRDNLVSEIGLLKQLRHRFILELLDFHWDDRNIYIVTELCTGGDLSAVIKARRKLPESQVLQIVDDVHKNQVQIKNSISSQGPTIGPAAGSSFEVLARAWGFPS